VFFRHGLAFLVSGPLAPACVAHSIRQMARESNISGCVGVWTSPTLPLREARARAMALQIHKKGPGRETRAPKGTDAIQQFA
jgi:hypothetical protein